MPVEVIATKPRTEVEVKKDYRFIDVGVNLGDPVFRGVHHGKRKHDDDFDAVLERCRAAGVKNMIITGTSLRESRHAIELAKAHNMYATVGCHPTRSKEFDKHPDGPDGYLNALDRLIASNLRAKGRVVAIGECGLDYDRTHFSPIEVQKQHFRAQLALAKKYHLALFLHERAAHEDFVHILREEGFSEDGGRAVGGNGGVVHSFTGSLSSALEYVKMGFHLSVNGCGLKSEGNLKAVQGIPLDRLTLETDAPWCSCTTTHASKNHLDSLPASLRQVYFPPSTSPERFVYGKSVKGRNEPTAIGGVAWVLHKIKEVPMETVTEQAWKNTVDVFSLDDIIDI